MNQNVAAILDKYKLLDKTHTLTEPNEEKSLFESNVQTLPKYNLHNQNGNVSFSNPELATQFTSILETSQQNKNFSTLKTNASETNHTQMGTLNTLPNYDSLKRRESHPLRASILEKNASHNEEHLAAQERMSLTLRQGSDKENHRKNESYLFNSLKLTESKVSGNGNHLKIPNPKP